MTERLYRYSNPGRIEATVKVLSAITEPDHPFTRLVFSPEYTLARTWLRSQMQEIGLICKIDDGGNLIGTQKTIDTGAKPQKVIIG